MREKRLPVDTYLLYTTSRMIDQAIEDIRTVIVRLKYDLKRDQRDELQLLYVAFKRLEEMYGSTSIRTLHNDILDLLEKELLD